MSDEKLSLLPQLDTNLDVDANLDVDSLNDNMDSALDDAMDENLDDNLDDNMDDQMGDQMDVKLDENLNQDQELYDMDLEMSTGDGADDLLDLNADQLEFDVGLQLDDNTDENAPANNEGDDISDLAADTALQTPQATHNGLLEPADDVSKDSQNDSNKPLDVNAEVDEDAESDSNPEPTSVIKEEGDADVLENASESKKLPQDDKKSSKEDLATKPTSKESPSDASSKATVKDSAKEDLGKSRRSTPPKILGDEDEEEDVEVKKELLVEDHLSDTEDTGMGLADVHADDKTRIRQTHAIVVPSYASWFNMKLIHQIEKDSLPEFFNLTHPSKSPKIYANYRNFMINAYRLNPNEYLTLTSCRRNLVGDVGTLMRVHRFLNKWGLINYQVNPQFKPAYALEKMPNGSLVGLPYTGEFHVQYDTPRGLFPFETYKPSADNINAEKLKRLIDSKPSINGLADPHYEDQHASSEPPAKKQKLAEDDWSPTELANLLLGIKNHKSDWYKIAKVVGNRTPQECILKFLKMPIEDNFNKLSEKDLGILKFASNFPVLSADNPVISNLIFMTNLVDADVVKAASANASKVIEEELFKRVEEVYGKKKTDELKSEEGSDRKEDTTDSNGNGESPHDEKLDEEIKKEFEVESSTDLLGEAATSVLGSVAARSHLFANYEEREMQRMTNTILNQELNKIGVKIKKINELEKIYQRERQNLAQQQSEIFIDRLALTRSTVNITKKLSEAVSILKSTSDSLSSKELESIASLISDAQSLLFKPAKLSIVDEEPSTTEESTSTTAGVSAVAKTEAVVKPLSVGTPQSFKVWVP
ncbi:CIC11C00000000251 [Sungouiella intermedia]|uniref:CIC11C00000000251 n=1 Tax=Sungouiella intermedia TaxID=45354 RepID=A0A1L0BHR0_9ASCO|nr:CIC11C00000000251 [[Candida] intermedia]